MSNVGLTIMWYRKQKGLNQSELAKRLGVSNRKISDLENNKSKPSIDTLLEICKILNIEDIGIFFK